MPRFAWCHALIALAVGAASGAAHAEPATDARQLYAEGKAEYAQGHYEQAVKLFERSYALSESPALLFNMAQAHRLAGPSHCADARSLYKSYLAAFPEAENRQEVEERIQELDACADAPAAAPAPAPEPPPAASTASAPPRHVVPAAPPPSTVSPTAPILVSGVGAALAVAGGVLYWRAAEKHRDAERYCPCYPGTFSNWEVLTNVSYALLAVGGATLAGGVTWWVVASPRDHAEPAQALLGARGSF
jgi:tetratricopeptide (TPR) repeat protein